MDDRDDLATVEDGETNLLPRRRVLGLLGIGGLVLARPDVLAAEADACPPIARPEGPPRVTDDLDLSKFPKVARFMRALAREDAGARQLREAFNSYPNEFLRQFYGLDDAAVAQVLPFKEFELLEHIRTQLPPNDAVVAQTYLLLVQRTLNFWQWWKGNYDKCFIDPLGCTVPEQYGLPKVQVYDPVKPTKVAAGKYELEVNGQGFVDPIRMTVTPEPTGTPIAATFTKHADSTFRCGRLNATVALTDGAWYRVKLVISGFEVKSDPFQAK